VLVRHFTPDDIEPYRGWLQPGQDWHLWDGPYMTKLTPPEIDERMVRLRASLDDGSFFAAEPVQRAVVALESDPAEMVGSVSWHWEAEESDWRRFGLAVYDPATRGKGIGTEAARIWVDHLFATTDVVRLDYSTWSGNTRMLAVGHRLGFTEEARFRDAREVRGERYDSVVMGVLRREWEAQPDHAEQGPVTS
jgi:RimJ/RimL family protein N-acetyltransferase